MTVSFAGETTLCICSYLVLFSPWLNVQRLAKVQNSAVGLPGTAFLKIVASRGEEVASPSDSPPCQTEPELVQMRVDGREEPVIRMRWLGLPDVRCQIVESVEHSMQWPSRWINVEVLQVVCKSNLIDCTGGPDLFLQMKII